MFVKSLDVAELSQLEPSTTAHSKVNKEDDNPGADDSKWGTEFVHKKNDEQLTAEHHSIAKR